MAASTKHPKYIEFEEDWNDIKNSLIGEREVKRLSWKYLPRTGGILELERKGMHHEARLVYDAYRLRAQYPEWVKDSTRSMIGFVSKLKSTEDFVYKELESLKEQATDDGFSIFELFTRCAAQGVDYGRYGLLADFDNQGNPYFAMYSALSIVNWKTGNVGGRRDLTMVVLQENHDDGEDEFSHKTKIVYRVLDLDESGYYRVRLFNYEEETPYETLEPKMGSKRINFIPFVFGGSIDNSHEPNPIPLQTMARCAIKYYQLSADYFQSLYMTAHPQPWIKGLGDLPNEVWDENAGAMVKNPAKEISVTGATCVWMLPKDSDVGYLEITGNGISLNSTEMDKQRNFAVEAGAKVIDAGANESGEARKARQDDQQATLHTIVSSAGNAIEQGLKYFALWLGRNEENIKFDVAVEFNASVDSTVLTKMYDLAIANKISFETVWDYLRTGKMPENDYLSEIDKIELEQNTLPFQSGRDISE